MLRWGIPTRVEADSSRADLSGTLYLTSQVQGLGGVGIRCASIRYCRMAETHVAFLRQFPGRQTRQIRNRYFQSRRKLNGLCMIGSRASSGVHCAICEHPGVRKDGLNCGASLQGVTRTFQAYHRQAVYSHRNRECSVQRKSMIGTPGLDLWLWQPNTLQEPMVEI